MSKTNGTEDEPSLFRIGVAGAGSGFVASHVFFSTAFFPHASTHCSFQCTRRFLSAPTELIKIRQQSAPIHSSPTTLSVISSIIRAEGVRGLYRGWTATAGRELGYGPYFITVCPWIMPTRTHIHMLIEFIHPPSTKDCVGIFDRETKNANLYKKPRRQRHLFRFETLMPTVATRTGSPPTSLQPITTVHHHPIITTITTPNST